MKRHLSVFGSYLLSFVAALLIGIVALVFAGLPFSFLREKNPFAYNMGLAAVLAVASTAWLFYASYKRGYKRKAPPLPQSLVIFSLVILTQQIATFLTGLSYGYAPTISGAATFLADAVFLGNAAADDLTASVPVWGYHVMMVGLALVCYLPALIGGETLGAGKREKERVELTGEREGSK